MRPLPNQTEILLLRMAGLHDYRERCLVKVRQGMESKDLISLFQSLPGTAKLAHRAEKLIRSGECDRILAGADAGEYELLIPGRPGYPSLLAEIPGVVPLLFARGKLELLQKEAVAVVGTRRADRDGKILASDLACALAERGFLVVSGAAEGIDAAAHRGAGLEQTCAILGAGFERPFPSHHAELIRDIGERGLLLSEHPPWETARRHYFPRRNRVVAGLSRATLVVQAPLKSGARITAREAIDMGREVFVCPGRATDSNWKGSHDLIRMGARLVCTPRHLIEDLSSIPLGPTCDLRALGSKEKEERKPKELTGSMHSFTGLLGLLENPKSIEELLIEQDLALPDLSSRLLELELQGLVEPTSDEKWRRCFK